MIIPDPVQSHKNGQMILTNFVNDLENLKIYFKKNNFKLKKKEEEFQKEVLTINKIPLCYSFNNIALV